MEVLRKSVNAHKIALTKFIFVSPAGCIVLLVVDNLCYLTVSICKH